jgi:Ca2+-binding RTX toxin-like protein
LNGGSGADTMTGGSGTDLFQVDNAGDVVIETGSDPLSGNDTVWSSVSYSLATSANVENLRITAAGAANATGNELNNTLYSGAGDNILDGGDGIDTASYAYNAGAVNVSLAIQGASQNTGTGGTDSLMGNADDNLIEGGVGTDTLSYANAGAGVNASLTSSSASGGEGNDILRRIENLIGSAHNDSLTGSIAANELSGGDGADSLNGGKGNDILDGGAENDLLTGGLGRDQLSGGTGADRFDFNSASESAVLQMDSITDFNAGEGDKIDLSTIDANSGIGGNQAFAVLTNDLAFSAATSFTAAGQLFYDQTAQVLYGNVDADAQAEFAIELIGVTMLQVSNMML